MINNILYTRDYSMHPRRRGRLHVPLVSPSSCTSPILFEIPIQLLFLDSWSGHALDLEAFGFWNPRGRELYALWLFGPKSHFFFFRKSHQLQKGNRFTKMMMLNKEGNTSDKFCCNVSKLICISPIAASHSATMFSSLSSLATFLV